MRQLQILVLLALAAALAYWGYQFTGGYGVFKDESPRFVINDIHSLVVIPTPDGGCEAAVGYREKHVIGTFVAEPVKKLVCNEYYFNDRPEARHPDAIIVLVRLESGEYHWILQSQLVLPL